MRYRQIQPGIEISEVGFGSLTVTTGWWDDATEAEAIAARRATFDAGATSIDTSNAYHESYGEQILGNAAVDLRDPIVTATNSVTSTPPTGVGSSSLPTRADVAGVAADLDTRRARLGADTIDVRQLHNPRMAHLDDDDLFALLTDVEGHRRDPLLRDRARPPTCRSTPSSARGHPTGTAVNPRLGTAAKSLLSCPSHGLAEDHRTLACGNEPRLSTRGHGRHRPPRTRTRSLLHSHQRNLTTDASACRARHTSAGLPSTLSHREGPRAFGLPMARRP